MGLRETDTESSFLANLFITNKLLSRNRLPPTQMKKQNRFSKALSFRSNRTSSTRGPPPTYDQSDSFFPPDKPAFKQEIPHLVPKSPPFPQQLPSMVAQPPVHRDERIREPGPVTAEEIHKLLDLIRLRFSLDIKIWEHRDVGVHDRRLIDEEMVRSDATLRKINLLANAMDDRALFSSGRDYDRFKAVKSKIEQPGKQDWAKDPIWALADREDTYRPHEHETNGFDDAFEDDDRPARQGRNDQHQQYGGHTNGY